MLIVPGVTYKLTFHEGFEELNGLYTVLQLLSNEEMISQEYTLEDTYLAIGKTEEEFDMDKPKYRDNTFVKILSIETEVEYFISELMLLNIPDFSVKPYYNLGLLVNLGSFTHVDDVSGMSLTIKTVLETNYGIVSDPIVMTHGKQVWLTDSEYLDILDTRAQLKQTIENPNSVIKKQNQLITELLRRNAALETLLLQALEG